MNTNDVIASIKDGTIGKDEGYSLLVELGDVGAVLAASAGGKLTQDEAMKLMAAIAGKNAAERDAAKTAAAKSKKKSGRKAYVKAGLEPTVDPKTGTVTPPKGNVIIGIEGRSFPWSYYPAELLDVAALFPDAIRTVIDNADRFAAINERFRDERTKVLPALRELLDKFPKAA